MAQPRRHWVKLRAPSSFLQTLPHFPTPISKTRQKKITAEEKKITGGGTSPAPKKVIKNPTKTASKVSSPAPSTNQEASNVNNFKINSGLKELSTSGLTMNSINSEHYLLDKSGNPTKKWIKKPTQFKTFSGFKIKYVTWRQKDHGKEPKNVAPPPPAIATVKEDANTAGSSTAPMSASETPETKVDT